MRNQNSEDYLQKIINSYSYNLKHLLKILNRRTNIPFRFSLAVKTCFNIGYIFVQPEFQI